MENFRPCRAAPGAAAGLQIRPLPRRFIVSVAHRGAGDDADVDCVEPPHRELCRAGFWRAAVSPSAHYQGYEDGAGRANLVAGEGDEFGTRGAGALYAGAFRCAGAEIVG